MIMRNSDPQYYRKINSLAMYMQRMFRGHQGRQMAVLRKMAQSKNMPVSLLSLKSVREQMLGERERLMKFKESETHSPAHSSTSKKHHEWDDDDGLIGEPKKKVHLTPELNELREQLLESVGSIVEETVRRELGKAGVGRSQPTREVAAGARRARCAEPRAAGQARKKKSSKKR